MTFVLAAILAATPLPRAAINLDDAVFVPRLDKLDGIRAFGVHAGERSAILRPSAWAAEFHPFLDVDPTRPASLSACGIDPAGDATVSWAGDGKLNCTALSDPKVFQQRADERLSSLGEVSRKTEGGATVVTSLVEKAVRAGYVLKGRYACAFSDERGTGFLRVDAAKRVLAGATDAAWQRALTLPGVAFGTRGTDVIAASGSATGLTLYSRSPHLALPALRASGTSPYAAAVPDGLLFARAQVAASSLSDLSSFMASQLTSLCAACDENALRGAARELAGLLTGNVLLRVDRVEVRDSLRTVANRYFAVKHAYLAELSAPGPAEAIVSRFAAQTHARAADEGFLLTVSGGDLLLGVHGKHLFLANDPTALAKALAALPEKPSKAAHAAEAWMDPQRAAQALRQVSLLDVMTSQELASVFAAGTELGPLLGITEQVSAWADGAGDSQRLSLSWALKPAPAPAPAHP